MSGKRAPILLGTGFFLKIAARYFIVTAGHVLTNERECELGVPGTRGLYLLPPMFRSHVGSGSIHDFDFAFDELPPPVSAALSRRYRAVPISWTGSNHVPNEMYIYTMVGFPTSRNKPGIRQNMLHAVAHPFHAGTLVYEEYERRGLDVALHLALGLQPLGIKNVDGSVRTSPNPRGISGCGVWCVGTPDAIAAGQRKVALVGIGVRYDKNSKHVEATRIAVLLEAMRDLYPELSPHIPRSEYVEVDFHLL